MNNTTQDPIRAALDAPGCERLRDFFNVGPVQRAAVESFVAALKAAAVQPQDMREALRTSLMKAFSERIPALSKHHEWYGWPGTFHFAEIAIDVLQAASKQASKPLTLPTFDECVLAVEANTATPLQKFIYDNEPSAPNREHKFRQQLAELLGMSGELNA